MALNRAAQELDDKRMKALREAEALVQREQEKCKHHIIIFLSVQEYTERMRKERFNLNRGVSIPYSCLRYQHSQTDHNSCSVVIFERLMRSPSKKADDMPCGL